MGRDVSACEGMACRSATNCWVDWGRLVSMHTISKEIETLASLLSVTSINSRSIATGNHRMQRFLRECESSADFHIRVTVCQYSHTTNAGEECDVMAYTLVVRKA